MLCVCVWCECGWRVVAIDAFPSGLVTVTATPPTPLRRGGGGGARTCATRRSIRRVARKGNRVEIWKTPRGVVVDSFCCDSIGGCCDARRCLLLHSLPVPEPELWPVLRLCQQRAWQGQEVKQAVAQAGNHTCVELSSARSRFEPFSAAMSTSSSSSRSCRGSGRHR
eukprot:scaffold16859_cov140-Isochrysis_galbana.AAC.1